MRTLEKPIPLHIRTKLRREFMKTHNLRQVYPDHWCLRRWMPEGCQGEKCQPVSGLPHIEHADSFRRPNGDWVLTYQPYELTEWARSRLDEFCEEHGLMWREMPEWSWHLRGATTLVVLESGVMDGEVFECHHTRRLLSWGHCDLLFVW